jgi:hypothetical protein
MSEEWQQPYRNRAGELGTALSGFVDTLDEVIVDHLRTAVENEVVGRPQLDKDLQAARRSIEKAIRLLDGR